MSTATAYRDNISVEKKEAPAPAGAGIADPGPLGLAGFALTTFVLSCFNAGIVNKGLEPVVLPLALFYGGIAQVLAGMWEFKKNNTFGALAFTSYGAFWLAFVGYVKVIVPGLAANKALVPDLHTATGLFLLSWTIFTAYMLIASFKTSKLLITIFGFLFVTFVLLTAGALGDVANITKVGGVFGLATAALAWYGSFAGVTNSTFGRNLLPTGPVKK